MLSLMQDVAEQVINPRFPVPRRTTRSPRRIRATWSPSLTTSPRSCSPRALSEAYPDAVVLGEEAHARTTRRCSTGYNEADHAFTVDPVDGTKNFVNGSPDHAVMIGEIRAGEVVRGVDLAAAARPRRTSPSAAPVPTSTGSASP